MSNPEIPVLSVVNVGAIQKGKNFSQSLFFASLTLKLQGGRHVQYQLARRRKKDLVAKLEKVRPAMKIHGMKHQETEWDGKMHSVFVIDPLQCPIM